MAQETLLSTSCIVRTPSRWTIPANSDSTHNPHWVWIALLVVLATGPFIHCLRYGFVYDDAPQIVDNPSISSLRTIPQFFTQSISKKVGFHDGSLPVFYRPLFFTQLCITHVLFGPRPFAFHLFPLLIHVFDTLGLYFLAVQFGISKRVALLAAMLFAVHPVHVESVAWASASPETMALASILVSLVAFRKFSTGAGGGHWLVFSVVAFVAGLFVKETALIVLPVIAGLVIVDRTNSSNILKRVLTVGAYAGAALMYLAVRRWVLRTLVTTITPTSWVDMARTWPSVLWFYVSHLVLPMRSSVIYGYDLIEHVTVSSFWLPLLGVLVCCTVIGYLVWKHWSPAALVAALITIFPIALVLNFRVFYWGDLVHDRYLYTPSAGFCLLLAFGLSDLGEFFAARVSLLVREMIVAALLCLFGLLAISQSLPWRNDLLLMANAVQVAPRNIAAEMLFGDELESRGYFEEASTCYLRALQIAPMWGPAWFSYGRTLLLTKQSDTAVQTLQRAVALDERPISLVWLSVAMDRAGRRQEAQSLLERAEVADPSMRLKYADLQQRLVDGH